MNHYLLQEKILMPHANKYLKLGVKWLVTKSTISYDERNK